MTDSHKVNTNTSLWAVVTMTYIHNTNCTNYPVHTQTVPLSCLQRNHAMILSTHKLYQSSCLHTNHTNYPVYTQTTPTTLSTHKPHQSSCLHTNHTNYPVYTQTTPVLLSTHKPHQLPCLHTNHTNYPVYTHTETIPSLLPGRWCPHRRTGTQR